MNREQLLARWGEPVKVGPDGFVRLIDYMGNDNSAPQAARVSYSAGTKTVREDAELVRFLMRHEHYSPFAMAQVKLHVRLPIFVHNQFVRHDRFAWNVMSARYSEMPKESWQPDAEDIRTQGQGNKQVANGVAADELGAWASTRIARTYHVIRTAYQDLLDANVGREQARTVLPMGQYTEAYVTANLGDWMLFLRARLNPHAQLEIRVFAEAIYEIFKDLFPVTMEAFRDYQLEGVKMSAQEMKALQALLNGELGQARDMAPIYVMGEPDADGGYHPNEHTGIAQYNPNVHMSSVTVKHLNHMPEARKSFLQKYFGNKRERMEFWKKIT